MQERPPGARMRALLLQIGSARDKICTLDKLATPRADAFETF